MGCASSKEVDANITTTAVRIQISPQERAPEDVLFTKSTRDFSAHSNSHSVEAVSSVANSKQGVSIRTPSKPSNSSSSLALSLLKNKLTPDHKARRNSNIIITVEPHMPRDVTRDLTPRPVTLVSACSRLTADSGYAESRPGLSSGSKRSGDEVMDFITENSSSGRVETVIVADRPTTPELLIEGISLAPIGKQGITPRLTNIPGSVDTQNILERVPLPPIHSKFHRTSSGIITTEENTEKQVEQYFNVIQRPSSRGGLAFDILMDVAIEKKNALKPIEFNPVEFSGNKVLRNKSTTQLTKEAIDTKLTAAETRRKKREQDIINNLVEQREIEERKMKEQQDRIQTVIIHREVVLGERMRTRSNNREAVITAKVNKAQREQEKVENARVSRECMLVYPADVCQDTSQN